MKRRILILEHFPPHDPPNSHPNRYLGVEQPDYCFSVIINIKVSKVSFMKDFSQVTTLRVTEGALQDPTVYINTQY